MHPIKTPILLLAALISFSLVSNLVADDRPADVDWDKARAIYQREQRGETLSPEEQAYLDHAKEVRRKNQGAPPGNPQAGPALPPRESTGMPPLADLKADQNYKGVDGGLYGHGRNDPPEKLLNAALGAKVEPLAPDGQPAPDGRVVLISIGMSNTTMEFQRFKQLADNDPDRSPKLLIVDCAQGGQDAAKWDVADGEKSPWTRAEVLLKSAGVTPKQVQVAWLKQALMGQGQYGEFPKHSDELQRRIESGIERAKAHYPNLKLVYLSSRIYAGYATSRLNPEPYAYEGAYSVRGVISGRLAGDLKPPFVLWGPYLWADGVKGRQQDTLVWKREDFAADGTHPSDSGRQKVAEQLLKFFKSDPTTKSWFNRDR